MAGTTPRTVRLADLTVDVSLSSVAQGDLLYRSAAKWNNLAAGTAGNLLATGGSGANPSWASRLNYASSGTILAVAAGATTDVPLLVNGAASHTGDLAQFKVNGTNQARLYPTTTGAQFILYTETGSASVTIIGANNGNNQWFRYGKLGVGTADADTTLVGKVHSACSASSQIGLVVQGTTSQSAPLLQLQGQSSTTAGRAQAEVDTAWVVDTDASRTSRLLLRTYYTSTAQEGLRIDSASDQARVAIGGSVVSGQRLTVYGGSTTEVPLVVDGAASASGGLAQFKVNGTTVAYMSAAGNPRFASYLELNNDNRVVRAGTYNGELGVGNASNNYFYLNGNTRLFNVTSSGGFGWTNSTSSITGNSTLDTGLCRSSAGVVKVTNGSTGSGSLEFGSGGNIVLSTTTGTKIGTGTTQLLSFWNATPVAQQVLATGAGAAVDDVISLLQTLGLCKQS